MLSPSSGPVAHALLTRPPLSSNNCPKTLVQAPFDLHVLSAPPAFVLSQDQTLNLEFDSSSPTFPFPGRSFACVFLVSHPESTVFLSLCLWHFRASTTLRSSLPLYSFQGSLLPPGFWRATDVMLLPLLPLCQHFFLRNNRVFSVPFAFSSEQYYFIKMRM